MGAAGGRGTRARARAHSALRAFLIIAIGLGAISAVALAAAGDLDPGFGSGGKPVARFDDGEVGSYPVSVAMQRGGRIVVSGTAIMPGAGNELAVAQFGRHGGPDTDFAGDGTLVVPRSKVHGCLIGGLAIQANGKVLVPCSTFDAHGKNDFGVIRLLPSGRRDTSFGHNGMKVLAFGAGMSCGAGTIAFQADGRMLVGGSCDQGVHGWGDFALARLMPDGRLDRSFSRNTFAGPGRVVTDFSRRAGGDAVTAILIRPDGRIVAVGDTHSGIALARYMPDGSLDHRFSDNGKEVFRLGGYGATIAGAALLPTGRVVLAFTGSKQGTDFAVVRLHAGGRLDASFGSGGLALADFGPRDVAGGMGIDRAGRVVVAGTTERPNDGISDFAVARFLPGGGLDPGFGRGGKVVTDFAGGGYNWDLGHAVAIQRNGKIVVAGEAEGPAGETHLALAPYLGD